MTKKKKPKTTTPWEDSQERQERIEAKVEALLVEGYRCFSQAQIQAERMVDCKKWCKNSELLFLKQNCEDECCNPCEDERHMYQAQRLEQERGRLIKHDNEDERRRILESPKARPPKAQKPSPDKELEKELIRKTAESTARDESTDRSYMKDMAPPKARPPKAQKPSPDKELEKEAPKDTPSESRAPQTPPSDPEPPKPKARPPRAQKPTPEQLELCLVPKAGPPKKSRKPKSKVEKSPEPKKDVQKSKVESRKKVQVLKVESPEPKKDVPSPEPEKSNAEEKEKSKVKEGRSMSSRIPKSNNAKENREGRARGSKDKEGRSRFSRSRSSKKVKESLEGRSKESNKRRHRSPTPPRSKESNKRRHRSPTPPWQQRKSSGHSFLNRKVKCFRGCDIRIGCTCAQYVK